jgi:hypothetical protein
LRGLTSRGRAAGLSITVGLVMLAAAGIASAHRPAVTGELRAMVFQASARYYGGLQVDARRGTPLACFTGDISTAVKGSQWGAWGWSAYARAPAHERQCRIANGISIEHKIRGRWYVLWEGSDGYPPTHTTQEGSFTLHGVPRAVAKDLMRGLV